MGWHFTPQAPNGTRDDSTTDRIHSLHFRPGAWYTLFILAAVVASAWLGVFNSETSGAQKGRQEIAQGESPG